MTAHDDALRVLLGWVAPSQAQDELRQTYVAHLRTHPDGARRTCVPNHLTASVLVMTDDGERVLLTHHARLRRWLQTGGHLEDADQTLVDAALREGREETGVASLTVVGHGPLLLDLHTVDCKTPGALRHLDVQYLAVTAASAVPVVSEESLDVRWFGVRDLPAGVDGSVRALVTAGRARLLA